MNKCSRCYKPTTNRATKITIEKPMYIKTFKHSSVERFYTLCGYCVEDLEEFLSRKEEE